MLPLYLSEDDEYPESRSLSPKSSSATKLALHHGDCLDSLCEVYINALYSEAVYSKADKRDREKKAKFAFKTHTNIYYKPEWVCAPGHGPHKLITAVRAKKIIQPEEHKAKQVTLSKKKSRRPSKYMLEPEPEQENISLGHVRTHPGSV
jgi:hypothetical protein